MATKAAPAEAPAELTGKTLVGDVGGKELTAVEMRAPENRSLTSIHPKVAGGAVGSMVAVIALWAAGEYLHITPPPAVDAAFTGLLQFVTGYIVKSD